MNAKEVADKLTEQLAPYLDKYEMHIRPCNLYHDNVHVTFASVPKGSKEIDCLNADKSIMLAIDSDEWRRTAEDMESSPIAMTMLARGKWEPNKKEKRATKISVRQFNGRSTFRKYSGTPEKVIAKIVDWFKKEISLAP